MAAVPQEAGGRNHHHRVWLARGGGHQTSTQQRQRPGDNREHSGRAPRGLTAGLIGWQQSKAGAASEGSAQVEPAEGSRRTEGGHSTEEPQLGPHCPSWFSAQVSVD